MSLNVSITLFFPAYCYSCAIRGLCEKKIGVIVLFHSFTPYQINATPLYMACENGHQDIVQWLLGVVADVEIARSNVSFS